MSTVTRPWPLLLGAIIFFGLLVGLAATVSTGSASRAHTSTIWLTIAAGSAALLAACLAVFRRAEREADWRNKRLLETVQSLEEKIRVRTLELETARQAVQAANTSRSSFLTNMSHEFRTPMNAIIGFSEVLSDQMYGPLNEKQQEYLGNILASGRHLLELLSDILDLSQVEAGKVALDFSTFLVTDLLDSCANLHRGRAAERSIRLDVEASEGTPDRIEGDERRLRQVLGNLLSNSLKFTPEGGSVKVRAQRASSPGPWGNGEGIAISVMDSGIGIRTEDLPRLFKEFSQVENPYTKTFKGTGLGLAMSRRIVELHGGAISVQSVFGRGSTFTFTLPLRQTPGPQPSAPGV